MEMKCFLITESERVRDEILPNYSLSNEDEIFPY